MLTKTPFWLHCQCKRKQDLCSGSRIHPAGNRKAYHRKCGAGTQTNEVCFVRLSSQCVLHTAIFSSFHQLLILAKQQQKTFISFGGRYFMHKEVNPKTSILIHSSAILIHGWKQRSNIPSIIIIMVKLYWNSTRISR